MRTILKMFSSKNGATAIEYGLIAGLVAVAIVGAVTLTGSGLSTVFTNANTGLTSAAAGGK